jgi:hypothetical protein
MDGNFPAQIVLASIAAFPIFCAVWSVWIAESRPVRLLQMQEIVAYDGEIMRQTHLWDRAFLIFCIVGYGEFIFGGIRLAFQSLSSYGVVGEDGWISLVNSLGLVAAIYGAFAFQGMLTHFTKLNFFDINQKRKSA